MTSSRTRRPSVGFVMVCVVYAAILGFFGWGLIQPDLDRVWSIHHLLKIGEMKKLKAEDRALLERSFARHAGLGEALLDNREAGLISAHRGGWIETPGPVALLTKKTKGTTTLVLDVQTPKDLIPYTISLRGAGWRQKVEVSKQGLISVPLPELKQQTEVLELRMKGKKFRSDPSVLGLRVSFEEAP